MSEADELRDRDAEVRAQRGQDRPGATLRAHPSSPSRPRYAHVRGGEIEQRQDGGEPADRAVRVLADHLGDRYAAPAAVRDQLVDLGPGHVRLLAGADQHQPGPGRAGVVHPVPEQVVVGAGPGR